MSVQQGGANLPRAAQRLAVRGSPAARWQKAPHAELVAHRETSGGSLGFISSQLPDAACVGSVGFFVGSAYGTIVWPGGRAPAGASLPDFTGAVLEEAFRLGQRGDVQAFGLHSQQHRADPQRSLLVLHPAVNAAARVAAEAIAAELVRRQHITVQYMGVSVRVQTHAWCTLAAAHDFVIVMHNFAPDLCVRGAAACMLRCAGGVGGATVVAEVLSEGLLRGGLSFTPLPCGERLVAFVRAGEADPFLSSLPRTASICQRTVAITVHPVEPQLQGLEAHLMTQMEIESFWTAAHGGRPNPRAQQPGPAVPPPAPPPPPPPRTAPAGQGGGPVAPSGPPNGASLRTTAFSQPAAAAPPAASPLPAASSPPAASLSAAASPLPAAQYESRWWRQRVQPMPGQEPPVTPAGPPSSVRPAAVQYMARSAAPPHTAPSPAPPQPVSANVAGAAPQSAAPLSAEPSAQRYPSTAAVPPLPSAPEQAAPALSRGPEQTAPAPSCVSEQAAPEPSASPPAAVHAPVAGTPAAPGGVSAGGQPLMEGNTITAVAACAHPFASVGAMGLSSGHFVEAPSAAPLLSEGLDKGRLASLVQPDAQPPDAMGPAAASASPSVATPPRYEGGTGGDGSCCVQGEPSPGGERAAPQVEPCDLPRALSGPAASSGPGQGMDGAPAGVPLPAAEGGLVQPLLTAGPSPLHAAVPLLTPALDVSGGLAAGPSAGPSPAAVVPGAPPLSLQGGTAAAPPALHGQPGRGRGRLGARRTRVASASVSLATSGAAEPARPRTKRAAALSLDALLASVDAASATLHSAQPRAGIGYPQDGAGEQPAAAAVVKRRRVGSFAPPALGFDFPAAAAVDQPLPTPPPGPPADPTALEPAPPSLDAAAGRLALTAYAASSNCLTDLATLRSAATAVGAGGYGLAAGTRKALWEKVQSALRKAPGPAVLEVLASQYQHFSICTEEWGRVAVADCLRSKYGRLWAAQRQPPQQPTSSPQQPAPTPPLSDTLLTELHQVLEALQQQYAHLAGQQRGLRSASAGAGRVAAGAGAA